MNVTNLLYSILSLHGKLYSFSFKIDIKNFNIHFLVDPDNIIRVAYISICKFTDMNQAILVHSEARGGAKAASDFGQLREPVLMVTGLLRALSGVTDGNRLEGATSNLGQRPYFSPTVFNYFMPDSKVPGTAILGPEFGIHTTVTAVGRANLVFALVANGGYAPDAAIPMATGTRVFLAPFEAVADTPAAMVTLVNQTLAGGQFPAALEPTIVTAVNAISISTPPTAAERTARARMAVYLMASSYDYQVQR